MAAGLGFKTFTTGEVLTAADTNGYLMQGVLVFASSAARAAAITSPQEGQYSYLKDTNSTEYYDGAAWIAAPIGDITGVTAGTGISGGGTSGTVTITNSMATEIAAKGDLIVGTGAATFDNLTVGTNNQILVADSTAATGLKWAAPAAAQFVGASVYKTASQTINNSTETALTFNAEDYDTDSFHDNSTNNTRMTIPTGKGGRYLVTATSAFFNNATGQRTVYIYKNGSTLLNTAQLPGVSGTIDAFVTTSYVVNVSAADYLEIKVFQNSGGTLTVFPDSSRTAFQVSYLGA
jgi:hypothetical protein